MDAYLVLHRGSRWTDVFRLAAPHEVILGRSSQNQIVLRSGRASRRHARLFCDSEGWLVEDLASRNGVFVDNTQISPNQPRRLSDGDRLQVAGFELRFTHDLTRWAGPLETAADGKPGSRVDDSDEQATQDNIQLSGEFTQDFADENDWMDVVSHPPGDNLLSGDRAQGETVAASGADLSLLQMAFAMGRVECAEADFSPLAELLMTTLASQLPRAELGLYFFETDQDLPLPRLVHQRDGHRYRRPPENLVRQIRLPGASALLARNVLGDRTLATEDTRGQIDVESLVLVPFETDPDLAGLVHATTGAGDRSLTGADLNMIVTACEIFSEACRSLSQRHRLVQSLQNSQRTIQNLRKQLAGRVEILGRSEAITSIQVQISQVARSGAAVLLRGESGTGKELVASAIHFASPRSDEALICLNCAALSKDLLESELFGHEKGAFTGATEQKKGKFEAASGGTLMLDEIGEMNLELQAKLLRVLEGHPFERVGGQTPVQVDVRVIAATHRDLQAMVSAGTFRQDLFYRLHVIEIVVPPLRDRERDCLLLANHFVSTFVHTMGRAPMRLSQAAQQKLLAYSWPGNVRELRNVIERAVVMAPLDAGGTHEISPDELLLAPTGAVGMENRTSAANNSATTPLLSLAELEEQHIARVLKSTRGNKSKAATILGIERSTLDRKLKRYTE
jgi:Nif-specific regulatory protein